MIWLVGIVAFIVGGLVGFILAAIIAIGGDGASIIGHTEDAEVNDDQDRE